MSCCGCWAFNGAVPGTKALVTMTTAAAESNFHMFIPPIVEASSLLLIAEDHHSDAHRRLATGIFTRFWFGTKRKLLVGSVLQIPLGCLRSWRQFVHVIEK